MLTASTATLAEPNLWIGAVIGIAMLAGAAWIRRGAG